MKKLKELVREYQQQKSANNHLVRRLHQLLQGVSLTCEDTNGQLGEHLYQFTHKKVHEIQNPVSLAARIISYDVFTLTIYNSENELLLSIDIGYEYSKYFITVHLYKQDKLSEEEIEQIIRIVFM